MDKAKIILTISKETKEKFNDVCKSKNMTMTSVVKMLISEYLKKENE